ncbi:hypothetical protein FRC01_010191, partial [Tulasnella sp. 417]
MTAATTTDGPPHAEHALQGSGNLLFGNLAADLVHAIFQLILELDRVHDYDAPFETLNEIRKTTFYMRCVSALWNQFILSSPQYWCIVNVRAPQAAMVRTIERAQSAPLCIYSVKPEHWEAVRFDKILPLLETRQGQIRTLRLDDRDLYGFGTSLLRLSLPNLRTLEVVPRFDPYREVPTLAYDMPQLRHLKSTAWDPTSDVSWIQGLETLVLRGLDGFGPDLYRALGLCAHSLRRLSLRLGFSLEGLPPTPTTISIPLLEELRLDAASRGTVMEVTRRILIPPSAGGIIHVILEPGDLAAIQNLVDFLFPAERNAPASGQGLIEIDAETGLLVANYARGNRVFRFGIPDIAQGDYEAIRDVIQYLDLRFGHPVISVTISCNEPYDAEMLVLLASSNVQSISILTYCPGELANFLQTTIGKRKAETPEQADSDEGEEALGFQSVRHLAIDTKYRELEELEEVASVIATRQEQLRAKGKSTLEEMVLCHCYPDEMIFADAQSKLGAVGIRLWQVDDSQVIVDFYL